jgi:hypothetical protein
MKLLNSKLMLNPKYNKEIEFTEDSQREDKKQEHSLIESSN